MKKTKIEDIVMPLEDSVYLKDNGVPQGWSYFVHAEVIDHEGKAFKKVIKPLPRDTHRAHRVIADAFTLNELLKVLDHILGKIDHEIKMNDLMQRIKQTIENNQN